MWCVNKRRLASVSFLLSAHAAAATIAITDLSVTPRELKVGQPFTIRVAAQGRGVAVGSYVIRSSHTVAKNEALPGFDTIRSGKAYLADQQSGILLRDNGGIDTDSRQGVFATRIQTRGWREGVYFITVFAHNRPAKGRHVVDYRNLRITVKGTDVTIDHLADRDAASPIEAFSVQPQVLDAGEVFAVRMRIKPGFGVVESFTLRPPYPIAESDVLPGFQHDSREKNAYLIHDDNRMLRNDGPLDRATGKDAFGLHMDTNGWRPGLYNFTLALNVRGPHTPQQKSARDFAVKIRSPKDQLNVEVEPPRFLRSGTHFGKLARLSNGTIVCTARYSTDRGETWQTYETRPNWGLPVELRDGRIIGMAYRTFPKKGEKGVFLGRLHESTDGGKTVSGPIESIVRVPQARGAKGHAYHPGPLFMRSIVERDDGALVALMCGWFHGDTVPSPYGGGRAQSRSFVCVSKDVGRSWDYLATVAYDPHIGNEGYNEGSMKLLPSGEILCVLRTGTESKPACLDNPLMQTRSRDGGRTWDKPTRMGVEGVYPDLIVMSDGTLACSYGRPGAKVMFSTDSGRSWTDHTSIDATPYSGYTAMCEATPGVILYGFGARGYFDEESGKRINCLRLTRIRVRRK